MNFCCLLNLFKINFFPKFYQCQTVWILIRLDILSSLIWVQTACKGYQQTTPAGKELISPLKEFESDKGKKLMPLFHSISHPTITLSNVHTNNLGVCVCVWGGGGGGGGVRQ